MTMYYSKELMGFFNSENMGGMKANNVTIDDLVEISAEDYEAYFNPPEGKMATWVDGVPVLLDIPAPDYLVINTAKREDLISEALSSVVVINTKLNMGRALTSAESDKMNKVLDYIDDLNSLDLSIGPTVEWPAKPTI